MTSAAGQLQLEAVAGNATGFMIVVDERMVIGRQSEGPGKLADDPELSRHHAEIERDEDGQFTIKDLASTNGTFVNGKQLEAPVLLALGDEIEVGGTKLVVRAVPAPAPPDVDVRARTVTVGDPPAEPEPKPLPLLVRLTVDFDVETAQLAAESEGEQVCLELADGQWRVAGTGA